MKSTGSRFGLTDEQWALAKEEVRKAILDAAYDRRMTWYGEVNIHPLACGGSFW
jgi:hypothetical protein